MEATNSEQLIAESVNDIHQSQQRYEHEGFSLQQIHQAQEVSLRTQPSYQNHFNRLPKRYQKLIKKMKIGKTSQSCTICLYKYQENQVINKLPCGHILHYGCCKQWFVVEHKCPVCRMNLKIYYEGLHDHQ